MTNHSNCWRYPITSPYKSRLETYYKPRGWFRAWAFLFETPGTTDKRGQCHCYTESLCGDIISPLYVVTGGWIFNTEAFQKICEIVGIWYLTIWIYGNVGIYRICPVCINFSYVFSMYGFYPHIIFSYLYQPLWSTILFVYEWQLHYVGS